MRNLRRAAAIFSGIVGASALSAGLIVGCGGDDTIVGVGGDSGSDVSTTDSSPDTGSSDAGKDAQPFDAGKVDLSSFYAKINSTGCTWLENCCGGASNFDLNACTSLFDDPANFGFLFTRTLQDTLDGGGNVTFDESKADQCLGLINAMSCTDPLTSAQAIAIRDACYGAIVGNIPAGGTGCRDSVECQPPAHCEPIGGGTCVAPYAQGATCVLTGDTDLTALQRCGRPYTGEPRFCEVGDFLTVPEAGVCSNPGANGTACDSPFECQSWNCDTNGTQTCADSAQLIVPGPGGTCDNFLPADAGDGG